MKTATRKMLQTAHLPWPARFQRCVKMALPSFQSRCIHLQSRCIHPHPVRSPSCNGPRSFEVTGCIALRLMPLCGLDRSLNLDRSHPFAHHAPLICYQHEMLSLRTCQGSSCGLLWSCYVIVQCSRSCSCIIKAVVAQDEGKPWC